MSIRVAKPGLCSLFQDLGRVGFQHLGVPVNGVMDVEAHRLANALVGNLPNTPTLEMTLQGPELIFNVGTVIAITGADLGAEIDGQPLAPLSAVRVRPGAVLAFGKRVNGARGYLAVRGGYALKAMLGSASTYTRGAYGGLEGRPLNRGDLIGIESSFANPPRLVLPKALCATASTDAPIRVLAGREWSAFDAGSQHRFLSTAYRIENESERMGYRLNGERLSLRSPADILSEAVGFGTIQVPPNGQPIILMADRQTTGGYPKIANVASIDLPRLAQKLPGDQIQFELIDLDQAQRLDLERTALLTELERAHGLH